MQERQKKDKQTRASSDSFSSTSSSGSSSSSSSEEDSDSEPEVEAASLFTAPASTSPKDARESAANVVIVKQPLVAEEETPETEEDPFQKEMEDKTRFTLYVEGISYDADEGDVVTHFSTCGGAVKEVRMPRYQDSNKPRGYAHVVFENQQTMDAALELDGTYLMKRYLTIRKSQNPRVAQDAQNKRKLTHSTRKGCRTVFIKHLPYDVDESTVQAAFESCDEIVSIRLPLWNHTKNLKGFGYVEFKTEGGALAAVKKNGMRIGNRMVLIDFDSGAPKQSFRTVDGQYWQKGQEGKQSLGRRMSDKTPTSSKLSQKNKRHRPF